MEDSILNFARIYSLKNTREEEPNYKFDHIGIPINTKPNTGCLVSPEGIPFYNKCCFISISEGLRNNGIIEIPEFDLMLLVNFLDPFKMIDTDDPDDQECLEKLSELFSVQLQFFIGTKREDQWYTTPEPSVTFGNGPIIRILNKGAHFEYITTPGSEFVYDPKSMTESKIYKNQKECFESIKQIENDRRLAEELFNKWNQ